MLLSIPQIPIRDVQALCKYNVMEGVCYYHISFLLYTFSVGAARPTFMRPVAPPLANHPYRCNSVWLATEDCTCILCMPIYINIYINVHMSLFFVRSNETEIDSWIGRARRLLWKVRSWESQPSQNNVLQTLYLLLPSQLLSIAGLRKRLVNSVSG